MADTALVVDHRPEELLAVGDHTRRLIFVKNAPKQYSDSLQELNRLLTNRWEMERMIAKLIKRLWCKHSKTKYIGTYLDAERPGVMRTHHIHECKECGKRIYN